MILRTVIRVSRAVSRTLTQEGISHALTGGFAVRHHGFERWTTDVEFVVPRRARRVIDQLWTVAFVPSPLKHGIVIVDGVEVAFSLVRRPVREADLSLPARRGRLPILGLDALVALKTTSALSTHIVDVVELLKL